MKGTTSSGRREKKKTGHLSRARNKSYIGWGRGNKKEHWGTSPDAIVRTAAECKKKGIRRKPRKEDSTFADPRILPSNRLEWKWPGGRKKTPEEGGGTKCQSVLI